MAIPEEHDPKAESDASSAATEVVAEAIAAMRDDPAARHAADAIQRGWSGQKLDVNRVVQETGVAIDDDAKDET